MTQIEQENSFYVVSPNKELHQPRGSVYLLDIFDRELLALIESQLIETGYFRVSDFQAQLTSKYAYFINLREIRIIPARDLFLNRQTLQFVRVHSDGSFSFYIARVEAPENHPFLLSEEREIDRSIALILPRLLPLAMFFHVFGKQYPGVEGIAPFFYGDKGRGEGSVLCYDSNHDCHVRLPDSDFLYRHAYQEFKDRLASHWIPWEERQAIAYWRGSATGDKTSDRDWRQMWRFQLCQFATEVSNRDLFDVKITRITNRFSSPEAIAEIKNSGFMAPYAAAIDQIHYKYLIDIDGHSSTWTGLFLRLLTGSTVLKIDSERGFRQWFHDRLIPWENFVPIKSDFSNLEETVLQLRENDTLARAIGTAGQQLANAMTLEREIDRALPAIAQCLKDNSDLVPHLFDSVS